MMKNKILAGLAATMALLWFIVPSLLVRADTYQIPGQSRMLVGSGSAAAPSVASSSNPAYGLYFLSGIPTFTPRAVAPWFQSTDGNLTAATMTLESQSALRTVTHSYTWTNAMVVALGAVGAGDITVATLPAKTEVVDAQVVILTPDTSANALTVACGRVSATFIDYITAQDAKAVANTVYGDASAERGTNLAGYDLPSYTATTDVKCHFIKTTTALNTVTGSTGRVILTTRLLP